jgi:hypothetical protein
MTQQLFNHANFINRSFFQKLFRQYPDENAIIELNNLLASKPLRDISISDVSKIESQYKVNLTTEFQLNLEEFYAVFLNQCLQDKVLTNEELDELKHLKLILSLDDKTISNLHKKIGTIVYKKSFEEAVADGRLTKDEEEFLNKLENDLKLPKVLAEKISSETRTAFIQNYISNVITDERLSPDEEKEIQTIATSLNVNVELNDKTKQQLQKLKVYWALENLELPTIQPDIALQKSESCYFQISNVNWYELRKVTQRVSYSGYSTSFKVAKGFYLRSGSYAPRSYSTDQMTLIDRGTVYLTNKRLIFTGNKKNSNIRLEKVLNIQPYTDGVEIGKETGKSPTLQVPDRADIFCMILERLLRER